MVSSFRIPDIPESERLTSFESLYLQYFLEGNAKFSYTKLHIGEHLIGGDIVPVERMSLLFSCRPVRLAVMALASFHKNGGRSEEHTLLYLGECYKLIRESLSVSVDVPLVYVAYTLNKVATCMHEPSRTIWWHLSGLCNIMVNLNPSAIATSEKQWIEGLRLDALLGLYWSMRAELLSGDTDRFAGRMKTVCDFLLQKYPMQDLETLSDQRRPSDYLIVRLQIYMDYFFIYYLLLVNGVTGTDTVPTSDIVSNTERFLIKIITQVIELLPRYNPRILDAIRALEQVDFNFSNPAMKIWETFPKAGSLALYLSAKFIRLSLTQTPCDHPEARSLGTILSRLSVAGQLSSRKARIDVKSLILAGSVLKSSWHPEGTPTTRPFSDAQGNVWIRNTIQHRLKLFVSRKTSEEEKRFLGMLPQILDQADRCRMLHDVWKLKAGDVSLWQCMVGLGGIPGPLVILP